MNADEFVSAVRDSAGIDTREHAEVPSAVVRQEKSPRR